MSYILNQVSMKQIEDKPKEEVKEPSLPVFIPMRIVRWVFYSVLFACALIPFAASYWQDTCGALILGHFASQLNALINKKP
jgi:hypothetical protein